MKRPKKVPGPGGGAPEPRCIAQQAHAVSRYSKPGLYCNPDRPDADRMQQTASARPEGSLKGAVGEFEGHRPACRHSAAYRDSEGRKWRYSGKRARVLDMLVASPGGITQWDCLPWHTRLGSSIHVMREDGLAISTELEGEYRHARYRLATKLVGDNTADEHRADSLKNNQSLSNRGARVG